MPVPTTARAYDRILKVARTIADFEGAARVRQHHIMEAIGYRNLDRSNYFNLYLLTNQDSTIIGASGIA